LYKKPTSKQRTILQASRQAARGALSAVRAKPKRAPTERQQIEAIKRQEFTPAQLAFYQDLRRARVPAKEAIDMVRTLRLPAQSPRAELMRAPQNLVGFALQQLTPAQRKAYKILRQDMPAEEALKAARK
jgi:hypothetical protein